MQDLEKSKHAIIEITPETPVEQVLAVMDTIDFIKQQATEMSALIKDRMVEWINANGDIVVGTVRYYVGTKKTTKCMDVPAAVEALLAKLGGDFGGLCELFASQPLKHGACSKVFSEDEYKTFFTVDEADELKEGKPAKTLQKIDTKFLR
jgi:hypothetical protein